MIQVVYSQGDIVEIGDNPTSYPLIGLGNQGAVFKLSSDKCVKIYGKPLFAKNEGKVLLASQESPIVPRVYEVGENYIVMEYFDGPSLDKYLKAEQVLSKNITRQILFIMNEMKRLNFTRVDTSLRHIFVTKLGELKVIDHVNAYKVKNEKPERLLKDLQKLGFLSSFMKQVKKMDSQTYKEWKNFLKRKKSII